MPYEKAKVNENEQSITDVKSKEILDSQFAEISKLQAQSLLPDLSKSLNEMSRSLLSESSKTFTNYFSTSSDSKPASVQQQLPISLNTTVGVAPDLKVTTKKKWGRK